jgi:AraC-like DNA-binding protein
MSDLINAAPLTATGQRLLEVAENVARSRRASDTVGDRPSLPPDFVQIYREWIAGNRGKVGTQQEQAAQWQLVMHAMVTAPDIEEAINRLIRFGKVVWGDRGPTALRCEEDRAVLAFAEPFRAGPEGLIAAIWLLALTLCELEFLAGIRFGEASGRVVHESLLPDGILRLLFAAPIAFDAGEVALVFPSSLLHRPVIARAADLPHFFGQLLPLTLGAGCAPLTMRSMVAGLVRDDKLGPEFRVPTLENVATRLGISTATLRRRLRDEGLTYRLVKEEVYNTLARGWLSQRDISVGEVGLRLGFSDGFAFRRFFHRLNGVAPSKVGVADPERTTRSD